MALPLPDLAPTDESRLGQLVIAAGREWEELCDEFVASGELPHPDLAGRLEDFFESRYWRAIEARDQLITQLMSLEFPELTSSGR